MFILFQFWKTKYPKIRDSLPPQTCPPADTPPPNAAKSDRPRILRYTIFKTIWKSKSLSLANSIKNIFLLSSFRVIHFHVQVFSLIMKWRNSPGTNLCVWPIDFLKKAQNFKKFRSYKTKLWLLSWYISIIHLQCYHRKRWFLHIPINHIEHLEKI